MHASTRRTTCRILFLSLCVAPTLVNSLWMIARRSPLGRGLQRQAWETRLEEHLGLPVSVERVQPGPRGGVWMHRIRLTEPETGRLVASAAAAEAVATDSGLVVMLQSPRIEAGQSDRLARELHDSLLASRPETPSLQVTAAEFTLHSQTEPRRLFDIRCQLEPTRAGAQLTIEFRPDNDAGTPVAQLRAVRKRLLTPPETSWQLHSGATPLPCSLLAGRFGFASLKRLGANCRFQGSLWGRRTASGWTGELSGRLLDVDLEQLIHQQFGPRLLGQGRIVLNRAQLDHGRLVMAAGSLRAEEGLIGAGLLRAACGALGLKAPRGLPAEPSEHRFRRLAVGFQLDASGLRISGLCPESLGALLIDESGPLLVESRRPTTAVALVRALSAEDEHLAPATEETRALLRTLPLPRLGRAGETFSARAGEGAIQR